MENSMLLKKENLFSNNVKTLVVQYKNDIIIKSINLFLSSNYRESEIVLHTKYPENSFKEDSLVQYLMGHIKLKLEEYELALNYFCRSLKNEVNQAALIYDSLGLTCLYQRDYNGAIKNFKDACNYSQNDFNYHNHLALCYKIIFNVQKYKSEKILNFSKSKINSEISNEDSNSINENSSSIESSDEEKDKKKEKEKKERDIKKMRKMTNTHNKIKKKIKDSFQEAFNINPNSYISLINLGTYYANEG